jgi:protein SCO1/2
MNWRLASRLSVLVSAILVVIIIIVVTHHSPNSEAAALHGTDLGGVSAPDFHLNDQFGNPISLSQFRGQPVVLTFLYTHCPDTCPLIADKLHLTLSKLGSDSSKVGVLAVSTDPQNDTKQSAYDFSQTHHMLDQWHFLLGDQTTLTPIWSAYHIYSTQATPTPASPGTVNHTVAIYLIDKQGHERSFYAEDFNPNELASDIQTLLK